MNRKRAIRLLVISMLILLAYASYALRFYYLKPPLEFQVDVPDGARRVIEAWHKNANDIPAEQISMNGIWHAISNPYNPSNIGYNVVSYEFGLIHVSSNAGGGYYVFFRDKNGQWEYDGSGYLNDLVGY